LKREAPAQLISASEGEKLPILFAMSAQIKKLGPSPLKPEGWRNGKSEMYVGWSTKET